MNIFGMSANEFAYLSVGGYFAVALIAFVVEVISGFLIWNVKPIRRRFVKKVCRIYFDIMDTAIQPVMDWTKKLEEFLEEYDDEEDE